MRSGRPGKKRIFFVILFPVIYARALVKKITGTQKGPHRPRRVLDEPIAPAFGARPAGREARLLRHASEE